MPENCLLNKGIAMKKMIVFVMLIMCSWGAVASASHVLTRDTSVAVMDFGTRPGATPAEINVNNAEYISCEYIISRLVERNCFHVVDKEFVMDSLKNEGIKTTGIIDPDTAKKIGQMLNVRYIIYGNVNNVSVSETGTQIAHVIGGGVNVCTVKANIIARIMDVTTGRIVTMARGEGKSKSSYVNVSAGSGGAGVVAIGTVKVTQDSVHNAIQKAAFSTVDDFMFKLFLEEKPKIG